MLFWDLLDCGQITLRRVDGWDTSMSSQIKSRLTWPPEAKENQIQEPRRQQFPPTSRHDHRSHANDAVPRCVKLLDLLR